MPRVHDRASLGAEAFQPGDVGIEAGDVGREVALGPVLGVAFVAGAEQAFLLAACCVGADDEATGLAGFAGAVVSAEVPVDGCGVAAALTKRSPQSAHSNPSLSTYLHSARGQSRQLEAMSQPSLVRP